ncbi:MAG: hypothetical protein Q9225_000739 [Loekoesia sp. 1 TL-2023]
MDSLATKRTPKAVQLALQSLPTEIGDTYDQAMERIGATNKDDREIVMNFLLWIAFSYRPLSVAEVEHASSISLGASDIDHDNILGAGELASMCAGLVVVDASNIVRLVHFSAQNYFREHREKWFSDGHTILARNCLTYLSYKEFEAGACCGPHEKEDFDRKVKQYPLIDYCCSFWGGHACKAQQSDELNDQIFALITKKPYLEFVAQAMWYSGHPYLANWDVKTGLHSIHLAAFFGLDQVVVRLLKAQNFVDCRDSSGTTPLMWAATGGHTQVVQILLHEGADPSLSCQRSTTALHRAIDGNHVDIVRYLLNCPNIKVHAVETAQHRFTPLLLAVARQRAEIVSMLMHTPGLDINLQAGPYKSTALGIAARREDAQIVRQILAHPDIDVNKGDDWCTPLTNAARDGCVSMVEALLDHGADPEIQEVPKYSGKTPLNRAIAYGHIAVVKLLLRRGANPKVLDTDDRTIIHIAAVNGQDEVLRILFDESTGVDVNAQDANGRTALHDAAYINYCETIKVLFENGARTDIYDGDNRSPLGTAKDIHNLEALELLRKLRKQESTCDAQGNEHSSLKHRQSSIDSNETGFHMAVKLGLKDAVQAYIESSKVDPNVDINLVDLDCYCVLHIAVLYDRIEILSMLLSAPNINLNNLDRFGGSPLHWCASHANSDAAKLLLNAGADYTLKDHFQETPLDISLRSHPNSRVGVLIMEEGAMPSELGMPLALSMAAQWGSVRLMERLVREGGGDPEMKDACGLTLVKRAEQWENWDVIRVILRLCEEKAREREKGEKNEDKGDDATVALR